MYMVRTSEVALVELWGKLLKKKRKTIIQLRLNHGNVPQDAPSSDTRDSPLLEKDAIDVE